MKRVKVFAPGTVANIGCGFDVMGLTLDGVGDVVAVTLYDDKDEFDRHASASGNAFVSTACTVSVKNNSKEKLPETAANTVNEPVVMLPVTAQWSMRPPSADVHSTHSVVSPVSVSTDSMRNGVDDTLSVRLAMPMFFAPSLNMSLHG